MLGLISSIDIEKKSGCSSLDPDVKEAPRKRVTGVTESAAVRNGNRVTGNGPLRNGYRPVCNGIP